MLTMEYVSHGSVLWFLLYNTPSTLGEKTSSEERGESRVDLKTLYPLCLQNSFVYHQGRNNGLLLFSILCSTGAPLNVVCGNLASLF